MKIRLAADGQTDTDRYGEANYCAVDGDVNLEVIRVVEYVRGVERWTVRVDCVVDSKVCLQTFCGVVVVVVVVRKKKVLDVVNVLHTDCNNSMESDQ
jgi:hypothetical protein